MVDRVAVDNLPAHGLQHPQRRGLPRPRRACDADCVHAVLQMILLVIGFRQLCICGRRQPGAEAFPIFRRGAQ